jgi:hypothetical protein
MSCILTITNLTSAQVRVVVRGGVEPPTYRFQEALLVQVFPSLAVSPAYMTR